MPAEPKRCLRCAGPLQAGFVVDAFHPNFGMQQARWQAGQPEVSFWTGIKSRTHLQKPIVAHRCENCGAIELFA